MLSEDQSESKIISENREKLIITYDDIFEGMSSGILQGFEEGAKRGIKDALKNCIEDELPLSISDLPRQILDNKVSDTAQAMFEKTIDDIFDNLLQHIIDEVSKGTIKPDSNDIDIINMEIDKQQKEVLQESVEKVDSEIVKQIAETMANTFNSKWASKFKEYEEKIKLIKLGMDISSSSIKPSPETTHEKIKENINEVTKEVTAEIVYNIIKYSTRKTVRKFTKEIQRSLYRRLKRDPSELSDTEIEELADARQKELLEKVIASKEKCDYVGRIDQVCGSGLRPSLRRLVVGIKLKVIIIAGLAALLTIGGTASAVVTILGDDGRSPAGPIPKPTADFSFEIEGYTVAFTDLSTSDEGITSWEWDFGDGHTSNQQNPTHKYDDDSTYTVSLTVYQANGNSDTETKSCYIEVTYELTMAVSGDGTTSPSEGTHTYSEGTEINITAIPDSGWRFDSWSGDVADLTSASTIVTIDGNKTVTANFDVIEVDWDKTFDGYGDDDHGMSVQQTSDGGYIITGSTYSYDTYSYDVWLIKTDSSGNMLWDKAFGGSDDDSGEFVQQTSDGGYIITGYTEYYDAGYYYYDIRLIKTDKDGNMLWDKAFGGSSDDSGESVQQTSDGGYIITGHTYSYDTDSYDVWLIKTDKDGNMLWDKTFGGSDDDESFSVQQTSDGGYIITGYTYSYDTDSYDVWLIKTDKDGNVLWDKTYGGSDDDGGYFVQQTSDGGYIITGSTYSYETYSYDVWLIKTDSYGDEEWNQTFDGYGDDDHGMSVQQTSDGGYIITGDTYSGEAGDFDVWLIRVGSEA